MCQTEKAKKIFKLALQNCSPASLIQKNISIDEDPISVNGGELDVSQNQPIYIIGAGKASYSMCKTLQKKLSVDEKKILCVTPQDDPGWAPAITASHPLPNHKSEQAARAIIEFVKDIPPRSLILFALSGGTSSLLCKPGQGLTVDDINIVNRRLLASGATIQEINGVRKHLSGIKGGRLLSHVNPQCRLIDLIISDVPGNDLKTIGSGPTMLDSSTFCDAANTLSRYDLWKQLPPSVSNYIEKGLDSEVSETLKPGEDPLHMHESYIIGSAKIVAREMARQVKGEGFMSWLAGEPYTKDVESVACQITRKIKANNKHNGARQALIFYGESTVEVTGGGKGGRNQELALRGAVKIADMKNVAWLSAGTDGIDGPTDAAGAVVDAQTTAKARANGLDAEKFLSNNDSYHFHKQIGSLLKTGPTGNNMMDITLVLMC